ncbi:MAG TPA: hypothetical protein VH092_22470 [Urbifossiella sp.]|jgi:hypothetical protein|nr:hypothetical protein [Urbifossiella sp.]
MTGRKLRLAAAAALLLGWLGWLGYAAAVKYRGPVVSQAQAAAATLVVHARVPGGDGPQTVEVVDVITGAKPDGPVVVTNLADAAGYAGPGEYLLLLARGRGDAYAVAGQFRSPGYDAAGGPTVYPWSPAVRAQAEARFR